MNGIKSWHYDFSLGIPHLVALRDYSLHSAQGTLQYWGSEPGLPNVKHVFEPFEPFHSLLALF